MSVSLVSIIAAAAALIFLLRWRRKAFREQVRADEATEKEAERKDRDKQEHSTDDQVLDEFDRNFGPTRRNGAS